MRIFVGLDLPDDIDAELARLCHGLPGARWELPEQIHLTLTFIGEVDGGRVRAVIDALAGVRSPPLCLTLRGIGVFPPRGAPRVVWVGVDEKEAVATLRARVDRALAPLGLEAERRKYIPHVTLARLKGTPPSRLAEYIAHNGLFCRGPVVIDELRLYSSVRARKGAKYRVEAAYGLSMTT